MNASGGPVLYHQRPRTTCPEKRGRACGRKSVFPSGRCGPCEDAHSRRDFAVLDSYLPGGTRHEAT